MCKNDVDGDDGDDEGGVFYVPFAPQRVMFGFVVEDFQKRADSLLA